MMNTTYLTVTTSTNDQTISDRAPRIAGSLVSWNASRDWRTAYSGDVPISPYTTPSAASIRLRSAVPSAGLHPTELAVVNDDASGTITRTTKWKPRRGREVPTAG